MPMQECIIRSITIVFALEKIDVVNTEKGDNKTDLTMFLSPTLQESGANIEMARLF